MSENLQIISTLIAALALMLPGLVILSIRLGRLEERQERQRIDHDHLYNYAHQLSHDTVEKFAGSIHDLQIQILKITPREKWNEFERSE